VFKKNIFVFFTKGFRTRSHYVAEPAEKFVSIDMYKRPLTNQPGKIIFDHGRPNNGYYLQRNQCKIISYEILDLFKISKKN